MKLLSTTADILAVVLVLVFADTAVESSVMVFLNDVHRHRVRCSF